MGKDTSGEETGASRANTALEKPQLSLSRIRKLAEKITAASATTAASANDPWAGNPQLLSALSLSGTWDIDPGTYAALLMHFKQRRAWRACVATLTHALDHEPHKLNARHFAMAISACGAARRHRDALRLLEAMQRPLVPAVTPSVKPDLVCFNAALSACAAAGDHGAALQLLHTDIPAAGLQPDAYSYSAAFSALGRCAPLPSPLPTKLSQTPPPPTPAPSAATARRTRRSRCSTPWSVPRSRRPSWSPRAR